MTLTAETRAKAWATRRAKYGPSGHGRSYRRPTRTLTIQIDNLGGFCPVQADGTINGQPFYFRARGQRWSIEIGGGFVLGGEGWRYEQPYGAAQFDAGYMPEDEARAFIAMAAARWATETPRLAGEDEASGLAAGSGPQADVASSGEEQ